MLRYAVAGILSIVLLTGASLPLHAQEAKSEAPIAAADKVDDSSEARLKKSEEYHKIRSFKRYVDQAVDNLVKTAPEAKRAEIAGKLKAAIDYEKMERASILATAEIFTVSEIQAMIDYYGSETGKAIESKMPAYTLKIAPDMRRIMDAALMDLRLGKTPAKAAE